MRRTVILALLLVAALGSAQEPLVYDLSGPPTLEWDAATGYATGDPFLATDTVEYEVYLWDLAGGAAETQPLSSLSYLATVSEPRVTVDVPYYSDWSVATRTVLTTAAGTVQHSELSYITRGEDTAAGVPFFYGWVLRPLLPPPQGYAPAQ